jgi:hypothetical protein
MRVWKLRHVWGSGDATNTPMNMRVKICKIALNLRCLWENLRILTMSPIPSGYDTKSIYDETLLSFKCNFSSNKIHSLIILIEKAKNPNFVLFLFAEHWKKWQTVVVVERWWKKILDVAVVKSSNLKKYEVNIFIFGSMYHMYNVSTYINIYFLI